VATEIKFCGLTRAEDAEYAATLGAAYVGVIFAGGPRMLTTDHAADVLGSVPRSVRRVGVFADQPPETIAEIADRLQLDVVQLHGASDAQRIVTIRRGFRGAIWPVCRVSGVPFPAEMDTAVAAGDGVLVDTLVSGQLGGTGTTLPWAEIASQFGAVHARAKLLVLAGGLRPENVGQAIATLAPDVVDVSSGVERAPGIKDHDRMRAFRDAVQASLQS
jgi:phosphoribosylanthranilate isomerase